MLLAITEGGSSGSRLCAGLLIVFAVLSSFYFPRRNPDFPGNRLGLFVVVAVVLFAVTMVGVFVFAAEEEERARSGGQRDGNEWGPGDDDRGERCG